MIHLIVLPRPSKIDEEYKILPKQITKAKAAPNCHARPEAAGYSEEMIENKKQTLGQHP